MARSPRKFKRYAWDSCSWLAGIWQEIVTTDGVIENRGALCRAVIADAEKGVVEICASALVLSEVCKHPDDAVSPSVGGDKLRSYFENDYIVIIPMDRRVGEMARDLMRQGHAGLKPLDATHMASAIIANVDEFHTFDTKLLNLDEKLFRRDGVKLKICKPSMGGPALPLLEPGNPPVEKAEGEPSETPTADEHALGQEALDEAPAANPNQPK